jgi:uncharacterized protein (DUF2141 family)
LAVSLALLVLQLSAASPAAAPTAALTIKVEGVSPEGGDIRVALYDRSSWEGEKGAPIAGAVVPATPRETIVVLRDLKPGVYGVKLFQDFNRNGEFDFTWLGLPAEYYGFSNDARATFRQPGFDRAKFTLAPGARTITIHLK